MYLLVCTDDPDEAVSFVVKFDAEFLVGLFEMCDFVV